MHGYEQFGHYTLQRSDPDYGTVYLGSYRKKSFLFCLFGRCKLVE